MEQEITKEIEELTPELEAKLKKAGFARTDFEPKQNQRFIVNMDGLPSYLIKGVSLPSYCDGWTDIMTLTLYNPVNVPLEQMVIDLDSKIHDIKIKILDPVGDVIVTWNITATLHTIEFDTLNWESKGKSSHVYIRFNVSDVKISYPQN